MSIETSLERIATALEKLAGDKLPLITGSMEATPRAPYQTAPDPINEYTDDDVRKAVREFMNRAGQAATEEMIVKFGAKKDKPRLSDVKDKNGLMNALKSAMGNSEEV